MDERPNFLLIMTDQQRGDCLGVEGHPAVLTPNMDSIAGAGVRFSRAYSTCPSCIAARRSLMTGQFPSTHGMVGYRDGLEWDAPPTLPDVLRRNGYQTGLVGRSMHLHPPRKRYGFETMVQPGTGMAGDYEDWLKRYIPDSGGWFSSGVMHNDWTAHPWPHEEALHFTNWTMMEALRFLEKRDPSCPFFLVVSFIAPHPPLQPPAFYLDRYLRMDLPEPHIGDWAQPPGSGGVGDDISAQFVNLTGEKLKSARAGYYGLINHVDDQIRRLLNPVKGIDRATDGNTVVMFTTDHGEMLGDHYHWRKQVPYEGSARIPFLWRAPQRFGLKRRSVVDEPVGLEDIMPTMLQMAGIEIPDTVEGQSVLPLMRGEEASWRDYLHIEHAPEYQAVTDGKEKFIWYTTDGRELYFDLANDPNELHNAASDSAAADRVSLWRSRLIEELKGRPEGFTDGERLISGKPFGPALPHVSGKQ